MESGIALEAIACCFNLEVFQIETLSGEGGNPAPYSLNSIKYI